MLLKITPTMKRVYILEVPEELLLGRLRGGGGGAGLNLIGIGE